MGGSGPRLITKVVEASRLTRFLKGVVAFCPITAKEWRVALEGDPIICRQFLSGESYGIHLWREMWRRAGVEGQTAFPREALFSRLLEKYAVDYPLEARANPGLHLMSIPLPCPDLYFTK